mmetsp:Transcript_19222/g.44884  ORF Transcript_19222/g.44884 Transcript_19222/m.44884 type:complete len:170 (+) Transcript_19222:997-1506(+)
MHLVSQGLGLRNEGGYAFRDWEEFENLSREIRAFCEARNDPDVPADERIPADVMPTSFELRKAGRYDLCCAIQIHCGFYNVARRMGLYCEGGYEVQSELFRRGDSTLKNSRVLKPGIGRNSAKIHTGRSRRRDEDDGAADDKVAKRAEKEMLRMLREELNLEAEEEDEY